MFDKKAQVDFPFWGHIISLRVMGVSSEYSFFDAGAPRESSGSKGCPREPSDLYIRATEIHSDG